MAVLLVHQAGYPLVHLFVVQPRTPSLRPGGDHRNGRSRAHRQAIEENHLFRLGHFFP